MALKSFLMLQGSRSTQILRIPVITNSIEHKRVFETEDPFRIVNDIFIADNFIDPGNSVTYTMRNNSRIVVSNTGNYYTIEAFSPNGSSDVVCQTPIPLAYPIGLAVHEDVETGYRKLSYVSYQYVTITNPPTIVLPGSGECEDSTSFTVAVSEIPSAQSDAEYNTFVHGIETDPLSPGGESVTGGGAGNFDNETNPLDFANDPELSAYATGMVSLFTPTNAQLASLANYLWSPAFDLDQFKKMFADPMSAIIGLSMVPVAVPSSGAVALKFGGFQTPVSMNKASGQYVNIDCGSVNISEYWGSALDYNPYTKVSIYLPYIGFHDLDTDEVMKQTISVKYKIDILSGACTALVKCGAHGVLYQYSGSCAAQIPVSNRDWSNVIGSAISVGLSAGAFMGMSGASVAAQTAAGIGLVTNSANAVTGTKINVQHSGGMGGMSGFFGNQTPYIIIKRARQALPSNYNKYEGYPSTITAQLKTLRGFTQIEKIHLENIPATSAELTELERILKEGIII